MEGFVAMSTRLEFLRKVSLQFLLVLSFCGVSTRWPSARELAFSAMLSSIVRENLVFRVACDGGLWVCR